MKNRYMYIPYPVTAVSFKDLVKVAQENSTNKIADILVEDQLQSPLDLVTVNLARPPQTKQLNQV